MRWLVLSCALAACQREPAPAPAPGPAPPPGPERIELLPRARVTGDLVKMTGGNVDLPAHGVFWIRGGLGSTGPVVSQVVLDVDAHRVAVIGPDAALGTPPVMRPIDEARGHALWLEANAVWSEPKPASEDVSDYAEDLVIVDGDAARKLVMRGPIHPSAAATLIADLQTL